MSLGAAVVELKDETSPGEQRATSRVQFTNAGNYDRNPKKCFNCGESGHFRIDMLRPTTGNFSRNNLRGRLKHSHKI